MPPKSQRPTRIFHILPDSAASLLALAWHHQELLERVRRFLPEPLGAHCVACIASGPRLALYADTPAWAFQLRFLAPQLLSELRDSAGLAIAAVEVRTTVNTTRPRPSAPPRLPSLRVAELVSGYAAEPADDALAAALHRLGKTLAEQREGRGERGAGESVPEGK